MYYTAGKKKAVHFGPGNIGRGFVASLLHNSGFEIIFAAPNENLIDNLNDQQSYRIFETSIESINEKSISNYHAVNSKTSEEDLIEEIATADLVTCAVGQDRLELIAGPIARGISRRSFEAAPVAIIACENVIGATDKLAEHIRASQNTAPHQLIHHDNKARYANAVIDCIVPAQDPGGGLDIWLETFHELVVDCTPFEDRVPAIEGVKWVTNLAPYIERKLYTVNTGHATAAYHGYSRGRRTIYDAMQDCFIRQEVCRVLEETTNLILKKHGITELAQRKYVAEVIKRIGNPHLEDSVERVGRSPLRKLGRKERLVGAAVELAENGDDYTALLFAIEMAFRFQNVADDAESKELAKVMATNGAEDIVTKVCGVRYSEKLYPRLVEIVRIVQNDNTDQQHSLEVQA